MCSAPLSHQLVKSSEDAPVCKSSSEAKACSCLVVHSRRAGVTSNQSKMSRFSKLAGIPGRRLLSPSAGSTPQAVLDLLSSRYDAACESAMQQGMMHAAALLVRRAMH